MRILADQCVDLSIVDVFRVRNHEVWLVSQKLGRGTKDPIIAAYADEHEAAVLTWNHKHFSKLMLQRTTAGLPMFPRMSLISFRCRPAAAIQRFTTLMDTIEWEFSHVQQLVDRRLNVMIGNDRYTAFR